MRGIQVSVVSALVCGFLSAAGCGNSADRNFSSAQGGAAGAASGGQAQAGRAASGTGGATTTTRGGSENTGGRDGAIAGSDSATGGANTNATGGAGTGASTGGVGAAAGGDDSGGLGGASGGSESAPGGSGNTTGGSSGAGTGGAGGAPKSNGQPCSADAECTSEKCADGVCCNVACSGQCESCSATANRGTCVAVQTPRTPCTGTATCAGRCDGTNRTACVYPQNTTSCGAAASCTNNTATTAALCNGAGACTPSMTASCTLGCRTDAPECATNCPSGQKGCNGTCIANAQCCAGCSGNKPVCENGTCVAKKNGDACSTGPECASGVCGSEGACCNVACNGQCESCVSGANRGTCVPVTTARTPCAGTGTCAGQCNGVNRTSCVYPTTTTTCAAAACTNGSAKPAAGCNGSGACSVPIPTTCTYGCQSGGTICSLCRPPSSSNLLPNPGFDGSATPWANVSSYSSNDADSCVGSGSIALLSISDQPSRCLSATAGVDYYLTFRFKSSNTSSQFGYCAVNFFSSANCNSAELVDSFQASTTSNGNWAQAVTGSATAPAGTVTMQFYCSASLGFGYYDQLYLGTSTNSTF